MKQTSSRLPICCTAKSKTSGPTPAIGAPRPAWTAKNFNGTMPRGGATSHHDLVEPSRPTREPRAHVGELFRPSLACSHPCLRSENPMPRAIWKGAITFGLVHVPVAMYPASREEEVDFDWLDKRTMDPVGYKRVNKRTGKEIDKDDIVKGVKQDNGDYVVLSNDEISA